MATVNYTTNYVGVNIFRVIHRQKHSPVSQWGHSAQIYLTGGGNGTTHPGAKTVMFEMGSYISPPFGGCLANRPSLTTENQQEFFSALY